MLFWESWKNESHYKKAIALNRDYPEAYVNIGNLYYGMQKLDEAEKNYREAIEIKPDYTEPPEFM